MKSPVSKVGTIDSEGIRNGSTKNDRKSSTARITGKNDFDKSTYHGSALEADGVFAVSAGSPARTRRGANTRASSNQMPPVSKVSTTRTAAKSIFMAVMIR